MATRPPFYSRQPSGEYLAKLNQMWAELQACKASLGVGSGAMGQFSAAKPPAPAPAPTAAPKK